MVKLKHVEEFIVNLNVNFHILNQFNCTLVRQTKYLITLKFTVQLSKKKFLIVFDFAVLGQPEARERRSQWRLGLRRRSAAARLLRSWVRIPPGAWMFVCCECSVLSGRGLCDELITRPEESYRLWCVVVCDLENSRMRRP